MKPRAASRNPSSHGLNSAGARRRWTLLLLAGITASSLAGTATYDYDASGRLIRVTHEDGKVTDYTLDPAGNRKLVVTSGGTGAGALQFELGSYSVGEATSSITINVTRTAGSTGAVGVTYAVTGGTASTPADFTVSTGLLSWAAGDSANKSVSVTIANDSLVEGNETIVLGLSAATGGASIGTNGSTTVTIVDDDVAVPGTLQFSAGTYSVGEAGPSLTIPVTRTGGTSGAVGVNYLTTTTGTATAGSDYTAQSGTLSWAAGDGASKNIVLPILEDSLIEGNETVILQLNTVTGGATLGTSAATVTITDNDVAQPGTIQFLSGTASVNENAGSVTLTARRSGGSSGPVSASVNTANISASAGSDYTAISGGSVSWANGDTADKSVTIAITNDSIYEGAEAFSVALSVPTGGATLGGIPSSTVTINDTSAAPSFSINNVTVNENATSASLTITMTGSSALSHAVTYATANGTATSGNDYTAIAATPITFAPGVTTQTVVVSLLDDTAYEGVSEAFTVGLSAPTNGAVIGSGTGTVTLTENDVAPSFSVNSVSVNENAGTATLTVTKTGNTSLTHQVNFATADGSATATTDYTATSGALTFAPGVSTQSITVNLLDDTVFEGTTPEIFTVTLTNPTAGATIGTAQGTVSITETDAGPSFAINSVSVNENAGTATLTVTKSGSTTQSHQVSFATSDGSATAAADYTATSGTLTFGSGVTTQSITVNLLDDTIFEGSTPETFNVALSGATGGASISTGAGTVSITDNDAGPSFSINSISVNENAGTATLTVTKSGTTTQTHQVSFTTSNGTATAGSDFTGISTPVALTFAPGVTTQSVAIQLLDDSVYEGASENFSVVLSSPTGGAAIITGTGTVTLTDNDQAPTFSINSVSVNEGGTASLTITKTNASALTHHISFQSQFGTAAVGADYNAIGPTTYTFAPSDTSMTVTVNAISDNVFEGSNEFYNVVLSGADNGASVTTGTGVVTIVETNNAPVISVQASSAAEGSAMPFMLTLSGTTNQDITVSYNTADGSAVSGSDYAGISSSHIFFAGETSSGISIGLTNDGVYEGNETFTLQLTGATGGAVIATPSVTGTIIDSSSPPQFAITAAQYNENAGTVNVTITKNGATAQTHQVHYANNGGTATAGTDYTAFSGDISFGPSETSKTFPLTISNDSTLESTETILAQLSSPTNNATIASGNPWTLTILDDDAPVLSAGVSSTSWSWIRSGSAAAHVSPNIIVTASGGTGTGFTYAWERVIQTNDDTLIVISAPASSSTGFTRSGVPTDQNASFTGHFRCKVTDSSGAFTYSPTVTATFTENSLQ